MTERTYSLAEIKEAAFDSLADCDTEEISSAYICMKLLICKLQELPPLIMPEPEQEHEKEPPKEDQEPAKFSGYGAKLKRATFARLTELRKNRSTSAAAIADASNGFLTVDDIFDMLATKKVPMNKWEALSAVLDGMEDGHE